MYFGISFHFSQLIYFYFMITNFYSFYKKNIKNNCGCSCNCRPEPEFIEEIVETIWKIVYVESPTSTIPPCRQNDAPGQYSSLMIPQKSALSGLAERTLLFFFFISKKQNNHWKGLCMSIQFLKPQSLSHASPSQLSSPTQKKK